MELSFEWTQLKLVSLTRDKSHLSAERLYQQIPTSTTCKTDGQQQSRKTPFNSFDDKKKENQWGTFHSWSLDLFSKIWTLWKLFYCPFLFPLSNSIILNYGFSVICFIFHEQPRANNLCTWTLLDRLTMRVKLIFNSAHSWVVRK